MTPSAHPSKLTLLNQVRTLIAESTQARFSGVSGFKAAKTTGYADGYMKAMLDMGLVSKAELLEAIGDARQGVVNASAHKAA